MHAQSKIYLVSGIAIGTILTIALPCQANCNIQSLQTVPVNFGAYDVFSNIESRGLGAIQLNPSGNCTTPPASIVLGNPSDVDPQNNNRIRRTLNDGQSTLVYYIYPGSIDTNYKIPIYGILPAGQDVIPGRYTDTIPITISY